MRRAKLILGWHEVHDYRLLFPLILLLILEVPLIALHLAHTFSPLRECTLNLSLFTKILESPSRSLTTLTRSLV